MNPDRSKLRWSTRLLATVLIPGLLLAGFGVLRFGGMIEQLAAEERADAELVATAVQAAFEQLVLSEPLDAVHSPTIGLDGTPFGRPATAAERPVDLAGRLGIELTARGEPARALEYLARSTLEPRVALAAARALAATGDHDSAVTVARQTATAHAEAWLDGVPVPTLCAMLEARLGAEAGDPGPANDTLRRLVEFELPISAAAALAAVDAWREWANVVPAGTEGFLTAALVALTLDSGHLPAPRDVAAGPAGSVLVPTGGGLCVVPPSRVSALAAAAARRVPPGWLASLDETGGVVERTLAPTSLRVSLAQTGPSWSERLEVIAWTLFALAAASFAFGNVILWRLAHREITLSRLRSNFVDLVSHELRTPLTALSVRAEMLAKGDVPPERIEHYQTALFHDTRRLSELVEGVLDFARLQRPIAPLLRPVPVRTLLAAALRSGRDSVRLGGQRLRVEAARDLPQLDVDLELMVRALRNLIENATRHAPRGTAIELRARRAGEVVELAVRDRGPGLGDHDPDELFRPFTRGATEAPGTGLGLAIVKHAVDVHGAVIHAGDRADGGAEFTIRLPVGERAA